MIAIAVIITKPKYIWENSGITMVMFIWYPLCHTICDSKKQKPDSITWTTFWRI